MTGGYRWWWSWRWCRQFLWWHECHDDDDVSRDDESDADGDDVDFWLLRRWCGCMELKIILMAMTMVPMEMMIAVKCNLQCNVAVFHSCSSGPANWGSGQLCNNSPIVVIISIFPLLFIISFITPPISSYFHNFPQGSSFVKSVLSI